MRLVLVTGGAGFIGSHIVEALLARGDTVRVVDNFSTGARENMAAFERRIDFVEGDLADPIVARRAVDGADGVFHEAAVPSVPRSIEDPVGTMHANVVATVNVLEAARAAKVRRVVFASSSSVYGDSVTLPKHEAMEIRPLSPYAASKLAGEAYCRAYAASMGLETVALRYFNIFGPRQNPDSPYSAVIPLFVRALIRGEPPTVHGDGGQTRDFTFVANAVAANLAALDAPGVSGGVFNVACGEQTSLMELLAAISDLVGISIAPRHTPSRSGDIRDSVASIDRARAALGYRPTVSLRDGLAQTVAWFRSRV